MPIFIHWYKYGMRLDQIFSIVAGEPRPLYIQRRVENLDQVEEWALSQGIEEIVLVPHVTQLSSKKPLKWISLSPTADKIVAHPVGFEKFGEAVVMVLESPHMQERHDELIEDGASHDFAEYVPHMTISYGDIDIDSLELPDFPLVLGPEYFDHIGDNSSFPVSTKETKSLTESVELPTSVIAEAIERVGMTNVHINPSPRTVEKLLRDNNVRGLAYGDSVYMWSDDAIHFDVARGLGIPRDEMEKSRFHIYEPWVEPHDGEDDWRGSEMIEVGDYEIAGPPSALGSLKRSSVFQRMLRNNLNESLVMPFCPHDTTIIDQLARGRLYGMKGVSPNNVILHRGNVGSAVNLILDPSSVQARNNFTFATNPYAETLIDAMALPNDAVISITATQQTIDDYNSGKSTPEADDLRKTLRAFQQTGIDRLYEIEIRVE